MPRIAATQNVPSSSVRTPSSSARPTRNATSRSARTCATAPTNSRRYAGAHRGTEQRAEARILDGVDLLVAASALLGRVLIAGFDGGLQRRLSRRRAHHPRRRGYLLACGLACRGRRRGRRLRRLPVIERSFFDLVLRRARPVRNDEAGHKSGRHDDGHPDRSQLPGIHPWASFRVHGSSWRQTNRLPWDGLQRVCQTLEQGLARIRAELWNRAGIRARLRVTSATECCALYSTG